MTPFAVAACLVLFVGCLGALAVREMRRLESRRRTSPESQTPEARSRRRVAMASSLLIACGIAAVQLFLIAMQRATRSDPVLGTWRGSLLTVYELLVIVGVASSIVGYVLTIRRERVLAVAAGEPDRGPADYVSAFGELGARAVAELRRRHPLPAIFIACSLIGASWLACNWSDVPAFVLVPSIVAAVVAAALVVLLKRRLWPVPRTSTHRDWAAMSIAAIAGAGVGAAVCFVVSSLGVISWAWS